MFRSRFCNSGLLTRALKRDAFCSVVVLICLINCSATKAQDLIDRFRSEAPKGWAVWDAWDANIEFAGELRELGIGAEKKGIRYICKGTNILIEETGRGPTGLTSSGLFCANSRYGFWIQRRSENEPWAIQYLDDSPTTGQTRKDIRGRYNTFLHGHDSIGSIKLSESFQQSEFVWLQAESVSEDGREFVKVTFRNVVKYPHDPQPVPIEGYYKFDPNNHWAIVQGFAELTRPTRGASSNSFIEITYSDVASGNIRPFKRIEFAVNRTRQDKGTAQIFDVTELRTASGSDSAFSLPTYGIAEPDHLRQSNANRWWIIAIAVGAVLVLGFVYRRRAQSAKRQPFGQAIA